MTLVLAGQAGAEPPGVSHGEVTFFPLPEIVVSPNEGTTFGALGVVLFSDEEKRIRRIIAPDVRYNGIFGVYPTFRYFGYPATNQRYFVSAGRSTKIDEYYELSYTGTRLLSEWIDFGATFVRERDSRERFYGIGNDTDEDDESNYTGDVVLVEGLAGVWLPYDIRVALGMRVRHMRIGSGGVDEVRSTKQAFPDAPGIGGETIVGQTVGLWWDTRDLPDAPTIGTLMGTSIEIVDEQIGSTVSFRRFTLEARRYQPLRRDRKLILAGRLFATYLDGGDDIPFYELSSMGGINNLRGFGTHRFRDRHRIGIQAELRSEVYRREIFGVNAGVELAPFVDVGKVFGHSRESPFSDLTAVVGLGVRAVVRPQVVAYIDNGWGGEGVATFTGINYPF